MNIHFETKQNDTHSIKHAIHDQGLVIAICSSSSDISGACPPVIWVVLPDNSVQIKYTSNRTDAVIEVFKWGCGWVVGQM